MHCGGMEVYVHCAPMLMYKLPSPGSEKRSLDAAAGELAAWILPVSRIHGGSSRPARPGSHWPLGVHIEGPNFTGNRTPPSSTTACSWPSCSLDSWSTLMGCAQPCVCCYSLFGHALKRASDISVSCSSPAKTTGSSRTRQLHAPPVCQVRMSGHFPSPAPVTANDCSV